MLWLMLCCGGAAVCNVVVGAVAVAVVIAVVVVVFLVVANRLRHVRCVLQTRAHLRTMFWIHKLTKPFPYNNSKEHIDKRTFRHEHDDNNDDDHNNLQPR